MIRYVNQDSKPKPDNGSPEYWIDICRRAIAICDAEEEFCYKYHKPLPLWVPIRRQQYTDELTKWEKEQDKRAKKES